MSKRAVMTYTSWIYEDQEDDYPITDHGYYELGWGEMSSYKDEDCSVPWDDNEMNDRRNAATIDFSLDEFDLLDGITVTEKFVDFLESWGLLYQIDHWFSSEPEIVNYRTGKYREYSLHFVDEDWTSEDISDIYSEIEFRLLPKPTVEDEVYWAQVKAIV